MKNLQSLSQEIQNAKTTKELVDILKNETYGVYVRFLNAWSCGSCFSYNNDVEKLPVIKTCKKCGKEQLVLVF